MSPAHFVLCVLSCIAFSGVTSAVYEDCKTPPPVDHARSQLFEDEENRVNTAVYNCATGYVLKGPSELTCNVDTEEWQGEPPTCLKVKATERKKKVPSYPEERNVPIKLLPKLDLSCIQAKVQAPEISHGIVSKYERRRHGNKVFLVAYYACRDNYDLERTQVNALYCSANKWVGELPTCLPRVEYDNDDNDYEEGEYEDNYEPTAEDPVAPPPPPPPVKDEEEAGEPQIETANQEIVDQPTVVAEETTLVDPAVQSAPEVIEPVVVVPVESEAATDISIVVAPTKDPFTPRVLDESCGEDRGGCAHKCERLLFPGENEPRLSCSCHSGFTLDPTDESSCLDIDECQESNGGCSQICNNLNGSFECACEKGFQIDVQTGNTCIDIDECVNPELSAECANGCENTPGSYRCVIPLNTNPTDEVAEETEQEASKEVDEIEVGLEPTKAEEPQPQPQPEPVEPEVKSEPESESEPEVKPSCNPGFALSPDASECQDINECDIVVEDDANAEHVPHRVCQQLCENTIGSFRCGCREGFHLLEDRSSCARDSCQDLDNPQLGRTRCAHRCENLESGGYECVCPEGYTLSEDRHSCQVAESVCSREQGHERCRPGSCLASEDNSTFSCLCPPGYASEVFSCQDIDECSLGSHKCSHDCFNTPGGYQCLCPRGMSLQEPEAHTCVAPDPCAVNNNGCEQLCLSAEQGACTCSRGFLLSEDGKSCQDVDECATDNGGCQQLCRNSPGSFECLCSAGYEPLEMPGLSGFCFDIDECATGRHNCDARMQCENLNGSYTCLCQPGYALGYSPPSSESSESSELSESSSQSSACLDIDECSLSNANCSHFCINLPGSFQCACPLGFSLDADARTCQDHDECLLHNGNCAQLCVNQPGGFACACNAGFELAPDGFNCLDIDECSIEFGSHTCACDKGYELTADGRSCQDVDECDGLLAGGCTHECINQPGSYECGCPLGYQLQEDEHSCQPVLVGCPPGTRHTDTGCEPIECGPGMLIGVDGGCVDIDECRVNNGGCSHQCENTEGSFKCRCPAGYQLEANSHDCEDVDECSVDNGGCQEGCVNEPGSFKCQCGEGKSLSFDQRSCIDLKPRTQWKTLTHDSSSIPPFTPSVISGTAAAPRDQCVRFQAPANGQAHCNKYRHKRKLFYNTRCKVRCNPGYQLIGSEIRTCGESGKWEGEANKCVPLTQSRRVWMTDPFSTVSTHTSSCPALPAPRNGVISPASCTRGASKFGASCALQCHMGYVPVGGLLTSCWNGLWSLGSVLECKPFGFSLNNDVTTRIRAPWQGQGQGQSFGQQSVSLPVQHPSQQHIKPYIKCPENVVIVLNPLQTKAHVVLQRPATNVDYRHVATSPAWAKQLQGHLAEGTHRISFKAHDPVTQTTVGCQTIITIKRTSPAASQNPFALKPFPEFQFRAASGPKQFESLIDASPASLTRSAEHPIEESSPSNTRIDLGTSESSYCPPSFEVQLKEHQNLRSVLWEEPRFEGKLLKIFKSHFPGALFGVGDHTVKYEATTTDGQTLRCSFRIHVKPGSPSSASASAPLPAEFSYSGQEFESYVICPGKESVKVTPQESVNLPVGCTLRNVRPPSSLRTERKRGLLTSLWRQYANL
ncbi:hypothetical protein ACLKA6_019174 [Drosophila palustris]